MKEMDIETLQKSSDSKGEYYQKKINLLFGIVQKIGANPDVEFRRSLEFPKYTSFEKADPSIIDSQESRCVMYIRYLESIIANNINSVDPIDRIELLIFEKKNRNWEEYLQNIVTKSEESETEEDSENIPIITKSRLGHFYREE
jgi:hypothetical protein